MKKLCAAHLQKALALEAKYCGLIEKLDRPVKVFTTKAKF